MIPTSGYNVLLVVPSDEQAKLVHEALARIGAFRIVSHVPDALAAVEYLRHPRGPVNPGQLPMPDIVLLDLKAPNCEHIEFLQWAQRRVRRPVLAVFSTENDSDSRKIAELLQADLHEPNIWQPQVFNRFLHFASNIVDAKRREKNE